MAQRKLDVRVEGVDTEDELGDLARAFNQMVEDFQKTTLSRDDLLQAQEQTQKAFRELQASQTAALNIMEDLEQFNRMAVGREERMIELKQKINILSQDLGRKPPRGIGKYELNIFKKLVVILNFWKIRPKFFP